MSTPSPHSARVGTEAPAPSWLRQSERGSSFAMRLMVWLALTLGRPAGRVVLHGICTYFVLFSVRARRASRDYLARVLGRKVTWRDVYKHYFCFAATILDRVFLMAGRYDEFEVEVEMDEQAYRAMRTGRGCILLGSHVGSFEMLRAQNTQDEAPPINVLMHVDNATKLNGVLNALAPELADRIIALGSPGALLKIQERLAQGELVGILGDRLWGEDIGAHCDFLGAPARFPLGPLRLAAVLDVPVVICVALYRGGRRYDLCFEHFADHIDAPRGERERVLRAWLERYAARLEHYCRRAPYNWFNFYDYWRA